MRYSDWCAECGHSEEAGVLMMNAICPLKLEPNKEAIKKVVNETNCTVMENTETDEYFLVLTGGGMNLSQDIAYAYFLLEKWIPFELCLEVCSQKGLSVGGKEFDVMAQAVIESLQNSVGYANRRIKEFKKAMEVAA